MPMYSVLGSCPGDGGMYKADNATDAFVQHLIMDYPDSPYVSIREEIKEDVKERISSGGCSFKVEGNKTFIGDYEINKISE